MVGVDPIATVRWGSYLQRNHTSVKHYIEQRFVLLNQRLNALTPHIDRAWESVEMLENDPPPAGVTAIARAARISSVRSMATALEERQRRLRIAQEAIKAEFEA
jgi:hypothetical protein